MLLMIDNYDSFTYNLLQYFSELGVNVIVYKNDRITLSEIERINPDYLVISPGPATPREAGISLEVIAYFAGKIPLLGVCLGHQAIVQQFGGKVIHAKTVMHGKTSLIQHQGRGIFNSIPNPFLATRYHSLVADYHSLPSCLEITAWTENDAGEIDEIMGIKHRELLAEGVQFHPESILTEHGHGLLKNFLERR